jgi:hypothetical protein
VSPLTSAECLAIAERKIAEAMGDRRHGKDLKLTAQAWMVLAEKVEQAEAVTKQAEALRTAKLAPDIASTAASSDCGSLRQIADDIRTFHLSHPASYAPSDKASGMSRHSRYSREHLELHRATPIRDNRLPVVDPRR